MLFSSEMRVLLLAALTLTAAPDAKSCLSDLTEEQLRKSATHIVVGEIKVIYERSERRRDYCIGGNFSVTNYVAEVRVINCEKGCGIQGIPSDFPSIKKDTLIYVRYWRRGSWTGEGREPPGAEHGHRGLPSEGETCRIYLARRAYDGFTRNNLDGGFNVIGVNGFKKLDLGSSQSASSSQPPRTAESER